VSVLPDAEQREAIHKLQLALDRMC
jgi:hypothetical protein